VPHQAAAADQSADTMDVALTIPAGPAASTASTYTTAAIAKAKGKVKKELTTVEREVQNQKRQGTLEEEKQERLAIMAARAQAQEDMKMRDLLD
jgi:hypothetical protein